MSGAEFEEWLVRQKSELRFINKQLHNFEFGSPDYSRVVDDSLPVIRRICAEYLGATAYQRVAIRELVHSNDHVKGLLLYYPSHAANFIHTTADVEWLQIGLAGALIENMSVDPRDTLLTLSDLYLAAERAGIDPIPYFETVGTPSEVGDPLPSNGMFRFIGGRSPTQGILRSFLNSEQLRYARAHGKSRPD